MIFLVTILVYHGQIFRRTSYANINVKININVVVVQLKAV